MNAHEPTIASDRDHDGSLNGGGGNSAALDADLVPEEFPDDRPLAARDYGTTEAEQARPEPLERRLRREEPENGADTDAVDSAEESPDLLSVFENNGDNTVKELATIRARRDRHRDDSGQPRSPRGAEEDAVHVVDEEPGLDD